MCLDNWYAFRLLLLPFNLKKSFAEGDLHDIFSSIGQRPVELMRYPFVRRPAVRLSVHLSVNNILFLYLLRNKIP